MKVSRNVQDDPHIHLLVNFLGISVFAFAIATSGCSSSIEPEIIVNGNSTVEEPLDDEVWILQGNLVDPQVREIETGTTLRWLNKSEVHHTVTNIWHQGLFDSGLLAPQQEFQYTFDDPGSYPYICKEHDDMLGTIKVK